jgi:hypothetical protein
LYTRDGHGKLVCEKTGPSEIIVVLHQDGHEIRRNSDQSLATDFFVGVQALCTDRAENRSWVLVAQYDDFELGRTTQHKFLDVPCAV